MVKDLAAHIAISVIGKIDLGHRNGGMIAAGEKLCRPAERVIGHFIILQGEGLGAVFRIMKLAVYVRAVRAV